MSVKEIQIKIPDIDPTCISIKEAKKNRAGNAQLFLNKELRWLDIKPGDKLLIWKEGDRIIITKV